jgi:hypothetical protein
VKGRRRLLAAVAAVLAIAPAATAQARPAVTVMTWDVYPGADLDRPFAAIGGRTGTEALVAFGNESFAVRQTVDSTDFAARADVLAAEILAHEPDLVGLQNVALWRRGPLDYSEPGEPTVRQVDQDFLQLLLAALGDRYTAVRRERQSDIEAPAFPGEDPNAPDGFNSRYTLFDVILRRSDAPGRVIRTGSRSFRATRRDGVYTFVHGFAFVDFRRGGRKMRFITTQLEPRSTRPALRQLEQVLAGPARNARNVPTILVCGCHSNPEDAAGSDAELPSRSVYRRVTQVFQDQWLSVAEPEDGHTAAFGELLADPDAAALDRRTDFVFGRRPGGERIRTDDALVVGLGARTPSGLWASNHAGIVARLRP